MLSITKHHTECYNTKCCFADNRFYMLMLIVFILSIIMPNVNLHRVVIADSCTFIIMLRVLILNVAFLSKCWVLLICKSHYVGLTFLIIIRAVPRHLQKLLYTWTYLTAYIGSTYQCPILSSHYDCHIMIIMIDNCAKNVLQPLH